MFVTCMSKQGTCDVCSILPLMSGRQRGAVIREAVCVQWEKPAPSRISSPSVFDPAGAFAYRVNSAIAGSSFVTKKETVASYLNLHRWGRDSSWS
jgi:hypothetical protein